jgi:hypothetical protein
MDYFSELLDSYDKLKKRTFKLRYISEAEEDKKNNGESSQEDIDTASNKEAEKQALEVVKAGLQQKYDETKRVKGGAPWAYLSPKKGTTPERISLTLGAGRPMALADKGGNPDVSSQGWKRLVGYFKDGGPSKRQAALTQAEIEAQKAEERKNIGGFFGQQGIDNPEAVRAMEASKKIIDKFCLQNKSTESLQAFCGRSWTYFAAGESKMGLEYKLATATAIKVVDPDEGTTKKAPASAGLVAEAAKSAQFLTSFLTGTSEEKCADVTKRIGLFKGEKLVLFGQEPNEGIVVGAPNAMHKLALKKIAASPEDGGCGIEKDTLTNLVGDGFDTKAKNAVKGTFYEALVAFSARVLVGEGKEAAKELMSTIKEKKAILKAILNDIDPDAGEGLDEAFDTSVQRELLDELSDQEALYEGIMRELKSTQPFVQFMAADGVKQTGKVSKTGQRADLMFTYKDKKTAEEKAKSIGSSVEEQEDGSFAVPVGLKRITSLKGTKFGEINSQQRMNGILTGDINVDRNIQEGFQQSMQQRQFGGPDNPREAAMISFARDLESQIETATSQLLEDKTYIDADGKIKSQTPEGVLAQLAKEVKKVLNFRQQKNAIIMSAFYEANADGELQLKDFRGDGPNALSNRERAREKVARTARFNRLQQEVEKGNEAAMDYIIKSVLICGSNTNNLGQVITDDSGEMVVIKHNEVFDRICNAMNDPESFPNFNFSEVGVTITAGGVSVSLNQEGNSGPGETRNTRSEARIPVGTLRNPEMQGNISMPQNNSSFEEYVRGHIKLLETFLS